MKYAKCIKASQIANNADDFINRQNEKHHVYCKNEITKTNNEIELLHCVPLNYIYDCLKYGGYLALIDVEDKCLEYPSENSYLGLEKTSSEQFVIDIMDLYKKETINFVFQEVGNPDLVHDGYIHFLSKELQEFFYMKKHKR